MVATLESPDLSRAQQSDDPLAGFDGTWWVAMTRPNYEQRLVNDLRFVSIRPVLLREQVCRSETDAHGRRHRRTTSRPLFSGYVFLNGDCEGRWQASRSLATLTILEVGDQRRLATDLRQIMLALEFCPSLSVVRMEPGTQVRITQGPLIGLTGYVVDHRPGFVHLTVLTMGTAAAVEVPPDFIERM